MRSFLGVPIVARGGVIGAFYLTDKEGADAFSEADERLIVLLAAHAAIAIENARLYERSRELSIVEERNRLARELHDSVTSSCSASCSAAESAGELLERGDRRGAREQLERVQALARGAMDELRSRDLRAAAGVAGGRGARRGAAQARRRAAARVTGATIELRVGAPPALGAGRRRRRCSGSPRRRCRTRCATRARERIEVRLERRRRAARAERRRRRRAASTPRRPGVRGRRLGLTSMEERARASSAAGWRSTSRPGAGTTVRLEVPA